MKLTRLGFLFLVALVVLLQACSGKNTPDVVDTPTATPLSDIPLLEDTQSIVVLDGTGTPIAEHRDGPVVQELLQGMREARTSPIDDPEPGGKPFQLVLKGAEASRTFEINDLSESNGGLPSVKLYAAGPSEGQLNAWSLSTAWLQLLMNANLYKEAPELRAVPDENSDTVTLVANRDMFPESLDEAIRASLVVHSDDSDAAAEFATEWTDPRRAVVRFPGLPQGARVEFMLEGTETSDGERFLIRSSDNAKTLVIRQGIAWSGLRWTDTSGRTVHEHGFDSAAVIQPTSLSADGPEVAVYDRGGRAYLLHLANGNMTDPVVREWRDEQEAYASDYGIDTLYSYSADKTDHYVARGLRSVYRIHADEGTREKLFASEQPIYGMAASPDGRHIAILSDAEANLGPYADLTVIDAEGTVVSTFPKAAYIGHSEGWHLIYPIAWKDDETVAVPLIGCPDEAFFRGTAYFQYREGLIAKEENPQLPEAAVALLVTAVEGLDPAEIVRALPDPQDEEIRYWAVYVANKGSYLIDLQDETVVPLGTGPLIAWTSEGEVVVWHSTAGKSVEFAGIG